MKILKRKRLSIDLEPYPDVKEMLAEAEKATGKTSTTLTVEALRSDLPGVVREFAQKVAAGAAHYEARFGKSQVNSRPKHTVHTAAPLIAQSLIDDLAAEQARKARENGPKSKS